ncbi:uncharacterized protein LOC120358503 [Solenopsis invicta]|uniref:uncharacterized protein LOC120358503 n=1 Tax=Solenopsis invicta TaxID=13686 RepID=UPI00193DE4F3|nr:uncharacterized protein LOC120358503 [Solenopsis invicta]
MSQDINTLMGNINAKDDNQLSMKPDNTILNKFVFPLKAEADMHELEEYLKNKEHANQFITELLKIGGLSYKNMTRRILQKLFSDNIAQTYSWVGFKGKKNFSILCVTSTILTAVQKAHTTSLAEIEKVIKMWLVKAKERHLKKARLTI